MFDVNSLTAKNTPMRWRAASKFLVERHPEDLETLNPNYKSVLEYVYEQDFSNANPPLPVVALFANDANSATFTVSPTGSGISWDGDYNSKNYNGTAPAAPKALDALTVNAGKVVISYASGDKPVAGKHFVFAFDATDAQGESNPSTISLIYAPAAPTNLVVSSAGVVSFTSAFGAASYSIEYTINALAPVVVKAASGFTVPGVVATDSVSVRVLATNPAGSSAYTSAVVEVIA